MTARLRTLLHLLAIALVGSLVMGATSGGIGLTMSVDPYQTPLSIGHAPVRGAYLLAWALCAAGLGIVALLCLWRRSRGHRVWRYGGSFGLALLALMAIWFVPGFVMGFTSPNEGGSVLGRIGLGVGTWLLTSFFVMFFNVINVVLVVPAIIEAWYAVLNRDTPDEVRGAVTRRRRAWLYGLTLVGLILIGCTDL